MIWQEQLLQNLLYLCRLFITDISFNKHRMQEPSVEMFVSRVGFRFDSIAPVDPRNVGGIYRRSSPREGMLSKQLCNEQRHSLCYLAACICYCCDDEMKIDVGRTFGTSCGGTQSMQRFDRKTA